LVEFTGIPEVLIIGLTILFVFSQAGYFVSNLLADLMIYRSRPNIVDTVEDLDDLPSIHVLMPIYKERRPIVSETLERLFGADYPSALINVYLVYEKDDDQTQSYLSDLVDVVATGDRTIELVEVDRPSVALQAGAVSWELSGDLVPQTKAAALKYAFRALSFTPDDVITVFDADTLVPSDTFSLAVSGLEEYDVVQVKQTVRNLGDGFLPRLEAMGMAAWSHAIYSKTSEGPYQLLGKGYFMYADDLYRLDDWDINAVTEDLTLGIDAYTAGYTLGIIDRYAQEICPSNFDDWVRQKRRWVAGPYPYLTYDEFTRGELLRFWTFSAWNQFVSVLNVVGVPAGLLYLAFVILRFPLYFSIPLAIITTFNLINWTYYTLKSYSASRDGVEPANRRQAIYYYLSSNPLTQLLYSTLWVVPIVLAVWDFASRGGRNEFQVTPK
jgi:cellulose synthase/poly-beta-1,6-N-acetylglucosamine synthase-like glycosyltransferase